MDWTRLQDAPRLHHKGSTEAGTIRKEGERKTKGNMETLGREGNEGSRMDVGTSSTLVQRQTALGVSGNGLMCDVARRGLSKVWKRRGLQP